MGAYDKPSPCFFFDCALGEPHSHAYTYKYTYTHMHIDLVVKKEYDHKTFHQQLQLSVPLKGFLFLSWPLCIGGVRVEAPEITWTRPLATCDPSQAQGRLSRSQPASGSRELNKLPYILGLFNKEKILSSYKRYYLPQMVQMACAFTLCRFHRSTGPETFATQLFAVWPVTRCGEKNRVKVQEIHVLGASGL